MNTRPQAAFVFALTPLACAVAVLTAAVLIAPTAWAAPQGGQVVAGQASITQSGNAGATQTTVQQGSSRAVIDWRAFNLGANETVRFNQPSAQSATLNRVVGGEPSAIFGRITATGQVYLINPNGILFGRTAQVNVGALLASTANISTANFMAGKLAFTEPGQPGASVVNEGSITVGQGGFAALVGRGVDNRGTINARLGRVSLAGGDAFVLDLYGDRLVNLVVDPAAMHSLTDAHGQPLAAHVSHSGEIVAPGGVVQLSAASVKQLIDNTLNVSGVVRATSFEATPGRIALLGDDHTRVTVSGVLDASGHALANVAANAAENAAGGRIEVTGRDVQLSASAQLDARGRTQGGSIALGGDWQGQGSLAHAQTLAVDAGARIDASAVQAGHGGSVALWSTERTRFNGTVAARGGEAGGDGGRVEVSSKGQLGMAGEVDVSAAHGLGGQLLLDPLNLRIAAVGSGDSEIAADLLREQLARGTSVTLSATQDVTVDAEINGLLATGGTAGGGLTLTAGNNLTVNQNIALNNGALNLSATAGQLSSATTAVLYTGNGAITLSGGAGVNVGQIATSGAVDVRSASGTVNLRNAVLAAGSTPTAAGSLTVQAQGSVSLQGALVRDAINITSTAGNVSLSGAVLQSTQGAVSVQAGLGVGSSGTGVGLVAAGDLSVTAGQAIDLSTALAGGQVQLNAGGAVTVRQAVGGVAGGAAGGVATGLGVQAGGVVTLNGARTGAAGISVNGSVINATGASLISQGPVSLTAVGDITLADGVGIATTGNTGSVTLTATAGAVTLGSGGIHAAGDAPITVNARGNVALNGDVQTHAGTIAIASSTGSVTAQVAAGNTPTATDAVLDAGADASRSRINVSAQGDVLLGEMRAQNDITVASSTGNVLLRRGLGGVNTGYDSYALGYQDALRPSVGRLVVTAAQGSVELNGLNLDGNALPTATTPGLSVTAGHMIVSNDQIAVNKGAIELTGGNTLPTDGVYLGNNVYSRGWDSVGADGLRGTADDRKLAYGIGISGRVLGLFDNTDEYADLPTSGTVAKVIVSNNPANYRDADLVPYSSDDTGNHMLLVDTQSIEGVGNTPTTDLRWRVGAFTPTLVRLSQTPALVGETPAVGVGLKLLSFMAAGDLDLLIGSSGGIMQQGNAQFIELRGTLFPEFGADYPLQIGSEIQASEYGDVFDLNNAYGLSNAYVKVESNGTRVFVFDRVICGLQQPNIDTNGLLLGSVQILGDSGAVSGSVNSSVGGFTGVGVAFSVGGSAAPNINGPVAIPGVAPPLPPTPTQGGEPVATPEQPGTGSAAIRLITPGTDAIGVPASTDEILLGQRPAALADWGRAGGVIGASPNLLRKRYPLASSSSATCADGNVQPLEGTAPCAKAGK